MLMLLNWAIFFSMQDSARTQSGYEKVIVKIILSLFCFHRYEILLAIVLLMLLKHLKGVFAFQCIVRGDL